MQVRETRALLAASLGWTGDARAPMHMRAGRMYRRVRRRLIGVFLMAESGYASAREFFEASREASIDADRISRRLAEMEASEGVRAQGYDAQGRGSGRDVNGMRRTEARIDFERRVEARREADYDLIDRATSVIYGDDQTGMGGIDALMGGAAADVMWWRFCAAATWPEVCREAGVTDRWARQKAEQAMDMCDAYGMWGMVHGLGVAEAG